MKTSGLTFLSAIAAVAILSVNASAQLMLDTFPTGNNGEQYVATLPTPDGQTTVTNYEPLPNGSLLGEARETIFDIGPNPYAQPSRLDVGNNILIVEAGLQISSVLTIGYGFGPEENTPLGLNLGAYSGLELNFAGSCSTFNLEAIMEVWPASGGYHASNQAETPKCSYASNVTFPYTSFNYGGLTQAEASDISYIVIELGSGYSQNYGITSLEAY